ncbi:MAG: methyltransferase domain-containing protein [Planctomycetes bacterium]|nr:methyltransferase domain-containing protein [Planctomycetota bacterium]
MIGTLPGTPPRARTLSTCLACGTRVESEEARVACGECGLALARDPGGFLAAVEEPSEVAYPHEGADLTFAVEEGSFWFRHRNRVLAALVARHPPDGPLWDVGGGNGFPARYLQERGVPVVVVEPGRAGCANAASRGVERVVRSTLEGLRLRDGVLRAASLLDVLEHLADPAPLLAECRRVLVPGGRLFVTVPAYEFLWSDEDVYARHFRRYTRRALLRELAGAGFTPLYLGYYFQALVLPILFLRTMPYRLFPGRPQHQGNAMDPSEHTPGRLSRAVLEKLLESELHAIRLGARLACGSSVVAVAERR